MSRIITDDLIEKYKIFLIEEEKSDATIEKYLYDVKRFADYTKQKEVVKETVLNYKKYLVSKYAVRSVNSKLASLSSFFRFFRLD